MTIQRILLATDFSELSERAARLARSLARAYGAAVHVLHVCEPVEVAIPAPEVGVLLRKLPPDEAELKKRLEEFAGRHFADLGVPVVTVLAKGKPAREITRYAREAGIDRVIVGTHARGIIRRIMHGSVSKSVLEQAPCAVLMVPPAALVGEDADQGRSNVPMRLAAAS